MNSPASRRTRRKGHRPEHKVGKPQASCGQMSCGVSLGSGRQSLRLQWSHVELREVEEQWQAPLPTWAEPHTLPIFAF